MRRNMFMTTIIVAVLTGAAPARLLAQGPTEHPRHDNRQATPVSKTEHERAETQPSSKPDLDALVAKMNAATGAAKVDAIAEVLTALVQKHKDCEAKMSGMMHPAGGQAHDSADHAVAH